MTKNPRWRAHPMRAVVLLGGAAILAGTAVQAPALADSNTNTSAKLRAAVTPDHVMDRLQALADIAAANDGNRAAGTSGYEASRDYIVDTLTAAGYSPVVQEFDFPFYRQLAPSVFAQTAPTPTSYVEDTDFGTMTYSGTGDVTAAVQGVDLNLGNLGGSTSGCETADFAGFVPGNIALIRRGACTFGIKVANADAAGATGVIIMNTGTEGATEAFAGTLGAPAELPAIGTSFAIGESLSGAGTEVHLATTTESDIRQTWNVLAETASGNDENVVMAGAHLDSVVAGPGINDNGSGSAALLEVAVQMKKVKPMNTVRFAWWGAEELGLLGSEHYVGDLVENDPETLQNLALYLNFDMIGSPNYALMVYDGDNSRYPVGPGAAEGPAGSGAIEDLFHDYFGSQGLPSEETPFSGRSDYGPFIAEGVPAGGLFTGHDSLKTEAQAEAFGGVAGEPLDPCYHDECDGLANVSVDAMDYNSDALAHAILTLAMDTRPVNGSGTGHPAGPPGQHTDSDPVGTGAPDGGGLHDHEELPAS